MGLILPAALDSAPVLVPLAALGLAMIMVGAVITRIRRREFTFMLADLAYFVLAGFVAWVGSVPSPSSDDSRYN